MTISAASMTKTPEESKPWWRYPMVWLVIGGPLVVVIAGIATLVIAIRNPDEVLKNRTVPSGLSAESAKAQLPAVEGRNHAVSPHVPGGASSPE